VKYGQNVELTIWGMDRHEWGLVHLLVGILLIVLLVLHLIFHWTQIVCMVKKLIPNLALRSSLVAVVLVLCSLLLLAPFFISPTVGDPIYGKGQRNERSNQLHSRDLAHPCANDNILQKEEIIDENRNPSKKETNSIESELYTSDHIKPSEQHLKEEHTLNIRGYHTYSELSEEYNISADKLKSTLGIPEGIPNNERLGRVRRTYNFTMSDVEEAILKLQSN
jgi:hypothetical protein